MNDAFNFIPRRQPPTFTPTTISAPPTTPDYTRDDNGEPPKPQLPNEKVPITADDLSIFTMSVADLASLLHQHGLDREERTIQRWCKAEKFSARLDPITHVWRIEPGSATRWLEQYAKDHQPTTPTNMMRSVATPEEDVAATLVRHDATRRDTDKLDAPRKGDTAAVNENPVGDDDPTDTDTVATLQRQITTLKAQVVTLEGDKQVREQMNTYMREQFEDMNAKALQISQENGKLMAQNEMLLAENETLKFALPGETRS